MVNSIKSFFKIVGLEITKVFRNKVVISSLILFTFVLLILMSFVTTGVGEGETKINIGINKNGADISGTAVERVLEISNSSDIKTINSVSDGVKKVSGGDLDLFINVNTQSSPLTISVYYDKTNYIARVVVNEINAHTSQLIQEATTEYLDVIGITLDDNYFDIVNFNTTNKTDVDLRSNIFVAITLFCLGVVIIYGLAYSMARDNETQTIKNVCYMPIGAGKYLLSKMVPYIILGLFELSGALIIGATLYNITYQFNIFLILLFGFIFIITLICLGLLLCMFKSQTAAIIVGSLFIIFPLLSAFSTVVRDMPSVLQFINYLIPGISFTNVMNCLVFNGVVLWDKVGLILLQATIFYGSSYLILKRKVEK